MSSADPADTLAGLTATATVDETAHRASRPLPRAATGDRERPSPVRSALRFFANELRVTFFRRRNQLLLLVTALFPLLIGIGLKAAAPHGGGGNGPASGG